MDNSYLKKLFLWFTLVFIVSIVIVAYLLVDGLPWLLILSMYVFFLIYLQLSMFGKVTMDRLYINPFTYMFVSFFTKVLLVVGFAYLLTRYFDLERKNLLLLLIT